MKNKVFICALLLSIITVMNIRAQNLPDGIWSSPQSTTTEGRYRSNADDFIRPDAYSGVEFNKWFGMVSFLWDKINNKEIATIGFAARADNLYIGAFYNGNFWANAPVNNYTEQQFTTAPAGGEADKTYNVYSNNIGVVPNPVNNAAVLFGVADMGFRLTYRTNHQSFKKSDIVTGNRLYKNYQTEAGYIAPQIAWAMAKDLTGNGIRPYITVDLVFYRDYLKVETAGADVDGNSGIKTERSLNHFDPVFAVCMGGYTFYNKDGFKGSFDLDYALTLNLYDNEYNFVENNTNKKGKIQGTYNPASISYLEQSYVLNSLTPSVSGSWGNDKLALKFKLNLPLTLCAEEANVMDLNTVSGKLFYDGDSDSTTTFTFQPDLRLALQYKPVPDRLTLNTGAQIQTTAISVETKDHKYFSGGAETKNLASKIHNDSLSGDFVSYFHLGVSFNFTENAWVEAVTGVSKAFGNSETIEIFAPGGLFSFGSVMVGLKF